MLPPGSLYYFYTLDDTQNYNKNLPERIESNPEGNKIIGLKLYDGRLVDAELEFVNQIHIIKNP